jgi:hypothetical protein
VGNTWQLIFFPIHGSIFGNGVIFSFAATPLGSTLSAVSAPSCTGTSGGTLWPSSSPETASLAALRVTGSTSCAEV